MKIYSIDSDYIEYLRQFDKNVCYPKENTNNRPYVGVVFQINNEFSYFAPLTHHDNKSPFYSIKIKNNEGKVLASVRINNMIPVKDKDLVFCNEIKYSKLLESTDIHKTRYGQLIKNEIEGLNESVEKQIRDKAKWFYKKYPYIESVRNISCNYKLLEEKAREYEKERTTIADINKEEVISMAFPKTTNPGKYPRPTETKEFNKNLIDMFIENIDKPVGQWHQTWLDTASPRNAVSGREYTGVNFLYLQLFMMYKRYDDPRFCTYTEAVKQKWNIKKGEKAEVALRVGFFEYEKTLENGKTVTIVEHIKFKDIIKNEPNCSITKDFVGYKYYPLFNAKQIDGIPSLEKHKHYDNKISDYVKNALDGMKIPLIIDKSATNPAYSHVNDTVRVPPVENFKNTDELSVSILHELVHATGHPNRLNRDSLVNYHKEWDNRCREELVAEIGALMTRTRAGIKTDSLKDLENHQQYCNGWKKALTEPKGVKFLESVIHDAQLGSDYVHQKEQEREKAITNDKNHHNELIETLEYSKVHLQNIGVSIEDVPGGKRYTLDNKQVDVVFSPNTKGEDSCKIRIDQENENHYTIPVVAQDTKDWRKIDKELCNILDERQKQKEEEGRER